MKLPSLPFLKKKPKEEFFISLLIKSKFIVAVLLKNSNDSLSIVATKGASLDVDKSSLEEMIAACDEAISSVELSLNDGYELEKTIFAVPYSWTDESGSIKKERLAHLKKISIELALKPMGFIVNIEALIKTFQDKEGVPLNAIFVEEAKSNVYIYLVKGGNIIESQSSVLEDDDVQLSVERALKKVENFEKLPSKMILLYHEDIESAHQKFLNYPWTRDLPFLHLPQVLLMDKGFENEAVVDAIASQLQVNISSKQDVAGAEIMEGEASNVAGEKETFGFLKERDIEDVVEEKEFPEDKNIDTQDLKNKNQYEMDDDNLDREPQGSGKTLGVFATILSMRSKIASLFSRSRSGSKVRLLLIPFAAVLFFAILMFGYYLIFVKAEVIIFLDNRVVKDEVLVNLSEEDETSFSDKILHVDTLEQSVDGKVTAGTTGSEEVGESAKGEVTILSSLNSSQKIESGTVLTSSNGLKFTLDGDVQIASSSGLSDIKSAKGKITAEEIGKEYNLPSNTKFSINGFDNSSLEAKNEQALAGGSKEEKQIVAQKDLSGLEAKLKDDLFEQAVSEARKNLGDDEEIISVLLDSNIDKEDYSASAGDEAKSVTLTGTIVYVLGVYKKDEAEKFINDAKGDDLPEGFVLSKEDSSITLSDIKQNKNVITGLLTYEVSYRPDIKFDNLPAEISGKGALGIEKKIMENEGVSEVDIVFKNKLPLLPAILPMRAGQIEIIQRAQN